MAKRKYSLGIDFGTNSCRALLVDITEDREIAADEAAYASGESGIIGDAKDPNVARQEPKDYIESLGLVLNGVIRKAKELEKDFSPEDVIGIGVDATSSTPLPVDKNLRPVAFNEKFRNDLQAKSWLWKDHSSLEQAEKITSLARNIRPGYISYTGGSYSPEWFFSKLLRLKETSPDVYKATYSFIELCDFIPAVLCGHSSVSQVKRGICAAGHKAMFNPFGGGLPDKEFLSALSPGFEDIRDRLFDRAYASDKPAGSLSAGWAEKTGLTEGTPVAAGGIDAHFCAVGAGIRPGRLVKIIGTSTCDIFIHPSDGSMMEIPGISGVVKNSVIPGYYGLEAGQPAVGDLLLWFVRELTPGSYGATPAEKFRRLEAEAKILKAGQSGLLALDWNNGSRTPLMDARLGGIILGQSLQTKAHEIYRALIEATAFGGLLIIEHMESFGLRIDDIVACGGLSNKNPLLMQIYADVTGREIFTAATSQPGALGAAIFGAVAAGAFTSVEEAQSSLCRIGSSFKPSEQSYTVYKEIYLLYKKLHQAFGTARSGENLYQVMKELFRIRETVNFKA